MLTGWVKHKLTEQIRGNCSNAVTRTHEDGGTWLIYAGEVEITRHGLQNKTESDEATTNLTVHDSTGS